ALIGSVPYLVALAVAFRRQEFEAALTKTLPLVHRLVADNERLEADAAQARRDWDALKHRLERGDADEASLRDLEQRMEAVVKRRDDLNTEVESLMASEEWKLAIDMPPKKAATRSRARKIVGRVFSLAGLVLTPVLLLLGPG